MHRLFRPRPKGLGGKILPSIVKDKVCYCEGDIARTSNVMGIYAHFPPTRGLAELASGNELAEHTMSPLEIGHENVKCCFANGSGAESATLRE